MRVIKNNNYYKRTCKKFLKNLNKSNQIYCKTLTIFHFLENLIKPKKPCIGGF